MRYFSLLIATVILFSGCGYSSGTLLPSKFKTIHVEPFKNSVGSDRAGGITYIPLLEVKVREAIIDRFLFNGHLRISTLNTSDLVMTGELVGFERQELRLTDDQEVQEFRIHIIVNLTLTDSVDQTVVWSEPGFTGEATYFVTGPQAKSESAAIQEALTDLARRAVERTLEDW